MNSLRIRFALGFIILFTVFLAIALFVVYLLYADFRKDEFYNRLKDKALTTFKLLTEVEQIDQELLQVIDKNTLNSLYDEKVLIFEGNKLVYSSIDDKRIWYNSRLFADVRQEKEIHTRQNEDELLALYIEQGGKQYTLLSAAYDKYGIRKMSFLKWVLLIVYFAGLLIGWGVTYLFVKKVIRPLDALKNKIQKISSDNLHLRLQQTGQGEEVDSLASSFNQMLERLQQSFSIQKDFVHYASHELRTPLTAMVGITENALSKPLQTAQYEEVLRRLFAQQQNLTGITNSLLLLSDKKISTEEYPGIRLDELVFRSVDIVQNLFPHASIQVKLEGEPLHEDALMINANEPLLLMAFNNLLKNAVQYAVDKKAIIVIRLKDDVKELLFMNTGEPIPPDDVKMIFTPFYRGANTGAVKGHGLGLPLVKQIADTHHARVTYRHNDSYNIFCFYFNTKDLSDRTMP